MKVKDILRITHKSYIDIRSKGVGIWFGNSQTINECNYLECEIVDVYVGNIEKNVICVEVGRVDYD